MLLCLLFAFCLDIGNELIGIFVPKNMFLINSYFLYCVCNINLLYIYMIKKQMCICSKPKNNLAQK